VTGECLGYIDFLEHQEDLEGLPGALGALGRDENTERKYVSCGTISSVPRANVQRRSMHKVRSFVRMRREREDLRMASGRSVHVCSDSCVKGKEFGRFVLFDDASVVQCDVWSKRHIAQWKRRPDGLNTNGVEGVG